MGTVVFFDADGVLLHPGNASQRSDSAWHHGLQSDLGIDHRQLTALFFSPRVDGRPSVMEECTSGNSAIEDVLLPILRELGYSADIESFLDYWFQRDAYVDRELLREVSRLRNAHGCLCFIVTSQEHRRAAYIWDELGLREHFDGMYYSAMLGHSKKSNEFYRAISSDFDFSRSQPIYFDDRIELVNQAASCGWDAHLYQSVTSVSQHPVLASLKSAD